VTAQERSEAFIPIFTTILTRLEAKHGRRWHGWEALWQEATAAEREQIRTLYLTVSDEDRAAGVGCWIGTPSWMPSE
jgi:hypothetical protein